MKKLRLLKIQLKITEDQDQDQVEQGICLVKDKGAEAVDLVKVVHHHRNPQRKIILTIVAPKTIHQMTKTLVNKKDHKTNQMSTIKNLTPTTKKK